MSDFDEEYLKEAKKANADYDVENSDEFMKEFNKYNSKEYNFFDEFKKFIKEEIMPAKFPAGMEDNRSDEAKKIKLDVNDELIKEMITVLTEKPKEEEKGESKLEEEKGESKLEEEKGEVEEEGSMFKDTSGGRRRRRRKMKGGRPICSLAGIGLVAVFYSFCAFVAYKGGEWAIGLLPAFINSMISDSSVQNLMGAGSEFSDFLIRQLNAVVFIFRAEMARNNGDMIKSIVLSLITEWRAALAGSSAVLSIYVILSSLTGGLRSMLSNTAFDICFRAGLTIDDGTAVPEDEAEVNRAIAIEALRRQDRALAILASSLSSEEYARARRFVDTGDRGLSPDGEAEAGAGAGSSGPRRRTGPGAGPRGGKKSKRKSRGGRRKKMVSRRRRK